MLQNSICSSVVISSSVVQQKKILYVSIVSLSHTNDQLVSGSNRHVLVQSFHFFHIKFPNVQYIACFDKNS